MKLFLIVIVLLAHSSAFAEPPPCFPERTLGRGSDLKNVSGKVIGVVAFGNVVVVKEVYPSSSEAEIEVDLAQGVPLVARIPADRLQVYARQNLEVVHGLAWWARGAAMRIYNSRPNDVLVAPRYVELPTTAAGGMPLKSPTWVRCEDLIGAMPATPQRRTSGCCEEAGVYTDLVRARKMLSPRKGTSTVLFESEEDDQTIAYDATELTLIRRAGRRSLVRMFDPVGIIIQGWVSQPLVSKREVPAVTSSCLDTVYMGRWWSRAMASGTLRSETPFASGPGAAQEGRLPEGAQVQVLERADRFAKVRFRRPLDGPPLIFVEGWVPLESLLATETRYDAGQ
jgi:hypothetical protein